MNSNGRDKKVLFGTNFPQLALGKCAEQARALELRPEARAAFFHDNARRVFTLP
jgi:predicted TIM-barrel fold metal-dependent hydrolase